MSVYSGEIKEISARALCPTACAYYENVEPETDFRIIVYPRTALQTAVI